MTIGIIGFGNMGRAIGERISQYYSVLVFDKNRIESKNNIEDAESLVELLSKSDVIILAVKPQNFDELINEIDSQYDSKLFISIAAGISTSYLEKRLPLARIVRVMPNLPAQIGEGLSAISGGVTGNQKDIDQVEELFSHVGNTLIVDEECMSIITAISGSGPGFYFRLVEKLSENERKDFLSKFISSLKKIALNFNFSETQAKILAEETGYGAEKYLLETKISPTDACNMVTSKGGTTEAGLSVLKDLDSLGEAIVLAQKRTLNMSNGNH